MVRSEVHIDRYDWHLRIFYAVNHYHADEIISELMRINCPENILERVSKNLEESKMDTGFTYSNKSLHSTVMVIGIHSSRPQFINSLEHELRHLVDDIANTTNLSLDGEDVAYLTGDINQMLAFDIELFMCGCSECKSRLNHNIY